MKLHSDTLRRHDVQEAARVAREHGHDIYVDEIAECGSKSRRRGITFYCESMDGPRARNGREGRAASWDAYGWLIAELFNRDPSAIIGYYKSPSHFLLECRLSGERMMKRDSKIKLDFLDHLTSGLEVR